MTGTVLTGSISVNDTIELPVLKLDRKIKSMQMFHKPLKTAQQGDRVGICITQFDPTLLERGIAVAPVGSVPTFKTALVSINRIPYFKSNIKRNSKIHVSVGHETVMAIPIFFSLKESECKDLNKDKFDWNKNYFYQNELPFLTSKKTDEKEKQENLTYWALVDFETPITCPVGSVYVASRTRYRHPSKHL